MKRFVTLVSACGLMAAVVLLSGCATTPVGAAPMKTGVKRVASIAEVKADRVDLCKIVFAHPPAEVAVALKFAGLRNVSCYLKTIGGKPCLYAYYEYSGRRYEADMARLEANPAVRVWRQVGTECLVGKPTGLMGTEIEEVFFTDGAAELVPTPAKYARIAMVTGLKPEKEAEYRTLHATTWPGVLKGIKDVNLRDFSIGLSEFGGKLYLFGYLEYVGADSAADDAAGKALPINKRWWKFTDACQNPLPEAAAKGGIWAGLDELYHQD